MPLSGSPSAPPQGRAATRRGDFDVRETVEDVCELLATHAHHKGVELAIFVAPSVPPRARGDAAGLRQVLINLVGSAIKLTDHGEVIVSVERVQVEGDAVLLRFDVVDSAVDDVDTAAGSRLQASRKLVEEMGGQIGREGNLWFTARLQPPDSAPSPPAARHGLAGTRALVVDDNATNRHILHHQLRSWDMEVDCAVDGVSALERMRDRAHRGESYQVVLLDHALPDLDGLGLARIVKADPALAGLHLVLLTSSGAQPRTAGDADLDAVLLKPVRQSLLHDCLVDAVAR